MRGASWCLLLIACAPVTAPPPEEGQRVTLVIPPAPTTTAPLALTEPDAAVAPHPEDRKTSPLDVPARDVPRVGTRSKERLLLEVEQLEMLASTMAPSAPDAPTVLRRIAETYLELHRADSSVMAARKAIDDYRKLIANYPTAPQLDQAMYALGLELELVGNDSDARRAYYDLIVKQPTSKWVGPAYFAFGEMFLKDGKADPSKWPLAKQSYQEAQKQDPSGPLVPWVLWRMMQIEQATGQPSQAAKYEAQLRTGFPQSDAIKRIGETL